MFKINNKKGFTLIELLVVISIISLLSSVILAGVKVARDKANHRAFRSEIMQFVNALEMFRNDHGGRYPNEVNTAIHEYPYWYQGCNNGLSNCRDERTEYSSVDGPLETVMSKYINGLPNARGANGQFSWWFHENVPATNYSNIKYRCTGDSVIPRYLIMIPPTYWGSGFEDWPSSEISTNDFSTKLVMSGYRCFSLK